MFVFHFNSHTPFHQLNGEKTMVALFLVNKPGPGPKVTDCYLLSRLTAVYSGLYFLVEAGCFTEQEVTVLNRRPPESLSSFSSVLFKFLV